MSENSGNRGDEAAIEFKIAREIGKLDKEIQPNRDLWPTIERRIAEYRQRRTWKTEKWMPWGIAAGLLIAATSLLISLSHNGAGTETIMMNAALDRMQSEYVSVRDPMFEEFNRMNQSLDPRVLEELYRNIEIMNNARNEIEAQIREHPQSRYLIDMLMRVNEQELDLLQQDYTSQQVPYNKTLY